MRGTLIAAAFASAVKAWWMDPAPLQTDAVAMKKLGDAEGWSPLPTTAPVHRDMLRRQAATQILGYVCTANSLPRKYQAEWKLIIRPCSLHQTIHVDTLADDSVESRPAVRLITVLRLWARMPFILWVAVGRVLVLCKVLAMITLPWRIAIRRVDRMPT